jgi:hypothetical protein
VFPVSRTYFSRVFVCVRVCECACVCVCVREREREREGICGVCVCV